MSMALSMMITRKLFVSFDVVFLYSGIGFVLIAIIACFDYRNRFRWIQDRILVEIPFEPSVPSWLKRFEGFERLVWLRPIFVSYLPFIAVWIAIAFVWPPHNPLINIVMIILLIPATLFYQTNKRIFDQRFTIQLADIGMIYNNHMILWSDSITSPWIDNLTVLDQDPHNCILEIDMARTNANTAPKTYRIPLPEMPLSQRQEIVAKIREGNEMNKSKNRNGRRFF